MPTLLLLAIYLVVIIAGAMWMIPVAPSTRIRPVACGFRCRHVPPDSVEHETLVLALPPLRLRVSGVDDDRPHQFSPRWQ